MCPLRKRPRPRPLGVLLLAVGPLVLFSAPPASPHQRLPTESLEAHEARLDATLWRGEIQALAHERTFTRLRDAIRASTNQLLTLARLPFDRLTLPSLLPKPETLDLGIVRQSFDDSRPATLSHLDWSQSLHRLAQQGWRLDDALWSHERFAPSQPAPPARSEFHFQLLGQRLGGRARFCLTGSLHVLWSNTPPDQTPAPHHLTVSNLAVLERLGDPGFAKIGVVTPSAPERHGQLVDLHPVLAADLDDDGDDDLVLAGINQLLLNRGDATFEPQPFIAEQHFHGAQVTGVLGDFNGDGHPDFITVATQGAFSNRLVLHPGTGQLSFPGPPQPAAPALRIPSPAVLTAGDIDHDGDLDLYLANGQISGASVEDTYDSHYWRHDIYLGTSQNDPALFRHFVQQFAEINALRTSYNGHQRNVLFLDLGTNRYLDVAHLLDLAPVTDCRAVIGADLDNDGRQDLLVTESEWFGAPDHGRNRLLVHRNNLPRSHRWIGARLAWSGQGGSPFGAKITVRAGDRLWTTQLVTGTSYHAQHPNAALFGLGHLATVDSLTVVWPNGRTQRLDHPALERYHRFE